MNFLILIVTLATTFVSGHAYRVFGLGFQSQSTSIRTVCVDAGHGGEDAGAIYNDLVEESVTLDIANRLKTLLEQNHYRVVMTRTNNQTTLTNSQRSQICNEKQAQLLVSIHLNANSDSSLDYTEGLYGDEAKDKKFTDFIHQSLVSNLGIGDGETTDFENNALLKAKMPATLQETVFLSSAGESGLLADGTGQRQQQIAQALFDGINNWFSNIVNSD
ncbi:MAG: N-acetylmuramoyl-L-alanine amidase [Patescibacteria group bacterium]|nr:N-acetylmuramoyl-L-alanine amidase [Patescibacteria group bacterium]